MSKVPAQVRAEIEALVGTEDEASIRNFFGVDVRIVYTDKDDGLVCDRVMDKLPN